MNKGTTRFNIMNTRVQFAIVMVFTALLVGALILSSQISLSRPVPKQDFKTVEYTTPDGRTIECIQSYHDRAVTGLSCDWDSQG